LVNPETNQFEQLREIVDHTVKLLRPDGTQVPAHWTVLTVGEYVEVKGYTFKVAYINETTLVLEPIKIPFVTGAPR
jgi:hypothetical protein